MTKKIESIETVEIIDTPHCCCPPHHFKRVSWTAIFIGAIVAIGLTFLLNLFGVAIGLSAFTMGTDGAIVLAVGGLIGIIIGVIASMLAAGYAAGYLGRLHCPKRNLGVIYGFTTWCVALILSAVIGAQISSYVTSYSNAISHSVLVSSQDKTHPSTTLTVKTTPSALSTGQKTIKLTTSPNGLAWGALSVFAIFFIGAFASCLGACWGMGCKRDD
jgi:hypothetical protein